MLCLLLLVAYAAGRQSQSNANTSPKTTVSTMQDEDVIVNGAEEIEEDEAQPQDIQGPRAQRDQHKLKIGKNIIQ